ncbi:MAG: PilZ domain-containing protein [Polyangia bacterium]
MRDLGARPAARSATVPYSEKRRHPRQSPLVRCWIADGKSTLYARLRDVSLGGFCVHAPVSFALHSVLEVALVVTGLHHGDPNGAVAVRARVRVVWIDAHDGDRRLGAQFTDFVIGESALSELVR